MSGLIATLGLDCYLTGVRVAGVTDLSEPGWMEMLVTLDVSDALGWFDGGRGHQSIEGMQVYTIAFGQVLRRRDKGLHEHYAGWLTRWQEERDPVVLMSEPGQEPLIGTRDCLLALPRSLRAELAP